MEIPEPLTWDQANSANQIVNYAPDGKIAKFTICINPGNLESFTLEGFDGLIYFEVKEIGYSSHEVYGIMSPDRAEEIAIRLLTVAEYARKEWEKQNAQEEGSSGGLSGHSAEDFLV